MEGNCTTSDSNKEEGISEQYSSEESNKQSFMNQYSTLKSKIIRFNGATKINVGRQRKKVNIV